MKKTKQKKFIIRVSSHTTFRAEAPSSTQAKYKVWNRIKNGYTYGYRNRGEFMKEARVE